MAVKLLQCKYLNRGTWKKIIKFKVFWKQNILNFFSFCKRTNNIHKFRDYFLRGQVSSNSCKVSNGCIVEPWISLVRLPKTKKKKLGNLLVSKTLLLDYLLSIAPVLVVHRKCCDMLLRYVRAGEVPVTISVYYISTIKKSSRLLALS